MSLHASQAERSPSGSSTGSDASAREGGDVAALHREMVRLRLVSARMVGLQRDGKVAFHASSVGEEAPIAAAGMALRDGDALFPSVRDWGAALARGLPLEAYVRQAVGSRGDAAKGHASPDHPTSRTLGVFPASGIAGAHLPQAVGWAWAARIQKEAKVAVALFGDEIASTGDFHNALNFAGVFKAPVVLVARTSDAAAMIERAIAYGLPTAVASGADATGTADTVREAVRRAREGLGPSLVCVTVKRADELGDDAFALSGLADADPIAALERALPDLREARAAIVADVERVLGAAVEGALRDGPPPPETLFEDVYASIPAHLAGQMATAARANEGATRP